MLSERAQRFPENVNAPAALSFPLLVLTDMMGEIEFFLSTCRNRRDYTLKVEIDRVRVVPTRVQTLFRSAFVKCKHSTGTAAV